MIHLYLGAWSNLKDKAVLFVSQYFPFLLGLCLSAPNPFVPTEKPLKTAQKYIVSFLKMNLQSGLPVSKHPT